MTGHGAAAGPTPAGNLLVELRSVNARGFVLKQRLCAEVAGLEPVLEERIRQRIARGTVTLTIERAGLGALPDREALRELVQQLHALARDLGLRDELSLRDVLALATVQGRSDATRTPAPELLQLVDRALDQLLQRRHAEGAAIGREMARLLGEFEQNLATARTRAPEVVATYREKLLARIGEVLRAQGLQVEPQDVVREVALFADRSDVTEELHRLEMHLGEVRATLRQGGEVGRRLDFLLQELLRETNTLGSKSPDVAMTHEVVAMKSCIDKLKEQAANLE